jgi:prepilin-type processing-associated H-X9-DG protein/prepilin-type N-terminal cleavage/methylation domain-containing protein
MNSGRGMAGNPAPARGAGKDGAGLAAKHAGGFTLVELLTSMAVVAILAALLLPALAKGKSQAQSAACRNLLGQIGLGLQMYVQDNGGYPPLAERNTSVLCFDRLYPYYPVRWTSSSWNCPVYLARNGIISAEMVENNSWGISYSYNWLGIGGGRRGTPPLGLGHLPKNAARELAIVAPGQMFAVADARCFPRPGGIAGEIKMQPYILDEEVAPHGGNLNLLFVDGHVANLRRADFLYPPRSACNWNSDNQPHPEAWAPVNLWAVQN